MAQQFLSAKIIKPPPTSLPPSAKFASNWNFYSYFFLLHTLHISDLRLECQIEDMHTRSYLAKTHVRLQKRKFFHILGKHSIP